MKKYTGAVVTVYKIDDKIYAVSDEYENGRIIDSDVYNVDSMTDSELQELITVGGVYVDVDTPNIKAQWIKDNGAEIASSVITDEGIELQNCNSDVAKIKRAFQHL